MKRIEGGKEGAARYILENNFADVDMLSEGKRNNQSVDMLIACAVLGMDKQEACNLIESKAAEHGNIYADIDYLRKKADDIWSDYIVGYAQMFHPFSMTCDEYNAEYFDDEHIDDWVRF